MLIKDFLETYTHCPFCALPLQLRAEVKNTHDEKHLSASVFHYNDRLNIKISSNYFVVANTKDIDFSISVIDGNILYCGMTSLFVSLYDLDIDISKRCSQPDHEFYRMISLTYDRSDSRFEIQPGVEGFSFTDNSSNQRYSVYNHIDRTTQITLANHKPIETPLIPLDKFPFHSTQKLISKLTNIFLLM